MRVVFHTDAVRELAEARAGYAKRGAEAYGRKLVELVDARLEEIAEAPQSFPRDPRRSWARRARIERWPYTLILAEHDGWIVILAMAHLKRRRSAHAMTTSP